MAKARRRRSRILKALGFTLVAGVAGVFGFRRLASSEEPEYRYTSVPAKRGDLREVVTATGTLKGRDSVDVGAQISGRIATVHVDVNDEVKAGQVLAEIDPAQLRSRVEQSRAQVRAADASIRLARATAVQAKMEVARARELNQKGLISSKELEAAEADAERSAASVASSEAQATLARATLKDAETSLSWSTIRAPIDGIVLARLVEPGQTVAASLQSPVLFTLARALAEAWPEDVPRDALIARAFRTRHPDDSHRVRLRVEIGRLRTALGALGTVKATKHGFALQPHAAPSVVVLAQPVDEQYAAVLACLADGESWSSSALALALGASQRSVQRLLETLAEAGKVQSFGRGPARRWMTPPLPGFATSLLLPTPLPGD